MNETTKTLSFVGAAAAILAVALLVRPAPVGRIVADDVGQAFFPEFKDPLQAKALDVVEFDEDQAALKPFRVAVTGGVWSIPSHSNYPADAQNQLALAANSLIDLKKLSYVSDKKGDQAEYGVVDPTSKDLTAASTGVGKKVVLEDSTGKALAQFIVGKADPQRAGVRFVRIPGQERIYRTELNIDKLSTSFGDWIEKDLLKLNAFDVKQLTINDSWVDTARRKINLRGLMKLAYDNQASKWSPIELKESTTAGMQDVPLKPDEELNATKLNDLKSALDDLKIIDVARKPAGLGRELRADPDKIKDWDDLTAHGFYPAANALNQLEIVSNKGEVICGLNDGVEYVIRFGEIAGKESGKKQDKKEAEAGKEEKKDDAKKDDDDSGTSRYVMVTTRFNRDLIPPPKLQPLPEVPATPAAPAATATPAANTPTPTATPATQTAPNAPASTSPAPTVPESPAATPPAAPTGGSCNLADEDQLTEQQDPASKPAEQPAAENKPCDKPAATDPFKEQPPAGAPAAANTAPEKPAADKPAAVSAPSATDKPAEKEVAKSPADLERERIEKENKRLEDEFNDKVKAGEKRVGELNDRFADWYYVISEATYKKIRLSRAEIVQKKADEKKDDAAKKDALPTDLPPLPEK